MGGFGLAELIVIVFIVFFTIVPIFVTYKIAKDKNRNAAGWTIAAIFFGWIATIIIAILPEIK